MCCLGFLSRAEMFATTVYPKCPTCNGAMCDGQEGVLSKYKPDRTITTQLFYENQDFLSRSCNHCGDDIKENVMFMQFDMGGDCQHDDGDPCNRDFCNKDDCLTQCNTGKLPASSSSGWVAMASSSGGGRPPSPPPRYTARGGRPPLPCIKKFCLPIDTESACSRRRPISQQGEGA